MKCLKLTLLLFFFSQSISAHSQSEDNIGLRRFFWGVIPSTVVSTSGNKKIKDLAPAQVGLGIHYDINKKSSLDAVLNAGLLIATDDALDPDFEFDYAVYPQIKFNINRFSVGVEYTYKKFSNRPISLMYGYHYFGIVLGGTIGKRIN